MSSLFDMYINEAYNINEGFISKLKERRDQKKQRKKK